MKALFTGKRTTDGAPINYGDTLVFHHEQEGSRTLAKFVRQVQWSDEHAAYITVCPKHGYTNFLANAMNDPNCVKVTKK